MPAILHLSKRCNNDLGAQCCKYYIKVSPGNIVSAAPAATVARCFVHGEVSAAGKWPVLRSPLV